MHSIMTFESHISKKGVQFNIDAFIEHLYRNFYPDSLAAPWDSIWGDLERAR